MATTDAPSPFTFTSAELGPVEDDLVRIMEGLSWTSEEVYLRPSAIRLGLEQRGHTAARVRATISRLVERGVLEVRERDRSDEHMFYVDVEPEKYFTTATRWRAFLHERKSYKARALLRADTATDAYGDRPQTSDLEQFPEFPPKQRRLLHTLHDNGPVSIALAKQAVYGTANVANSTLEQLVSRTNKALIERGYRFEIRRKSNTLSLRQF
jgi:hypothetical protein